MKLDHLIEIADSAYSDGLIGLYYKDPKINHGDTLAKFICMEIIDTYDSTADSVQQLNEAVRVMESAGRQVDSVSKALLDAKLKLPRRK